MATPRMIWNSSYVLIRHPSLPRLRAGTAAALLAARVSILYCQGAASAAGQGRFSHLTKRSRWHIIYLTREPKAGWSPAAGESNLLKVAPYLTRTGALLFVFAESNNKSNDGTDHAHEREQITVCNHTHQLLSEKSGSWSIAPSVPRVSILYCQGGAPGVPVGLRGNLLLPMGNNVKSR